MKNLRLMQDTSLNDLGNEYELHPGSVLPEKLSPALAEPSNNTGSERGYETLAHDTFSRRDVEKWVRVIGKVMAFGAQGHIFCSDLMLCHWNRNLCAVNDKVEDVEEGFKGQTAKVSELVEVGSQALMYFKRSGVYSRDTRR